MPASFQIPNVDVTFEIAARQVSIRELSQRRDATINLERLVQRVDCVELEERLLDPRAPNQDGTIYEADGKIAVREKCHAQNMLSLVLALRRELMNFELTLVETQESDV